ncbi:MAG TPA: 2-oxoacid:acceptor oxidoreductase family protein, partial [Kiritimatiellia bacterium]|nr:2-oxoacid:acceptor oxidoreductase family protein [Kiritimatiellia bacterium]
GVRALAVPAAELAKEGGSARAANTAMVGVLAALGGFDLPEPAYREAFASQFAGKESVVQTNLAVFELARQWAARLPA